ncbi:MAG: bifunctional (p)ppGpp synthetase/guanosine-3',5'-bis(diphosphate) 3'-pyrophosphohydrolase [Spirochaetia bacterium]|jgi:GTP pyrophosphokinase|nr:bifunctional (p)ppGpp synthetase/guanosine-3',5'-bis(diphosphate) 3'-pyrophosphohydrolase [Spirochaetia bacterium]
MYEQLIERFLLRAKRYSPEAQEKIRQAVLYSAQEHEGQKRKSGEPYIIHPIAVAEILIQLNMDADTVCAGLLHDTLEDTSATYDVLEEKFGKTVADLVDSVTKIEILKTDSKSVQEAETIRKMFIAMSKDARVIIIKLADKLHNMRTVEHLSPQRAKEFSRETLDIYAPLADRLGISWVKDELEDLSLKTISPDTYTYIQDYMLSKKSEQTAYLKRIEKSIMTACAEEHLGNVLISSRAKHAYSVYMKMKKRKKDIEEIYDLLGVRILCDSTPECYQILGIVHRLWPPIEGRFKDYIAMPKANNYQSLHTTVMALDGKLLEIQIRTKAMHQIAEYGIASHWKYKVDSGSQPQLGKGLDEKQFGKLLQQMENWSDEISHNPTFMDDLKTELLKDTIFVFTPQGHLIELPYNATALDFAYKIHTEVGNHTAGAKANGSIISLGERLKSTQVIEILTSPNAHPHLSWLRYAQTSSAKKKIKAWLNKNDASILIEKDIIAKSLPSMDVQNSSAKPTFDKNEIIRTVEDQSKMTLKVGDETNMLIHLAQCCHPQHGDAIVGYVSRGRGIIVHKKNCPNLRNMKEIAERTVEVEWDTATAKAHRKYRVTSKVTYDLFSEIEGAIKKYQGHLIEGRLFDSDDGKLVGTFTIEVDHVSDFRYITKALKQLPSINTVSAIS